MYTMDVRSQIKTEKPELENKQILQGIGRRWRGLTAQEKQPYIDSANIDRERYKKELAAKKIYLEKRKAMALEDIGVEK